MKKTIKMNNLNDIRSFTSAATDLFDTIHVQDSLGAIANAKSILGVLALNCAEPLTVISDSPEAIGIVCKALEYKSIS